jgi:hypothetical protein
VRAGIARVERLLARANDPGHHHTTPNATTANGANAATSDNASEENLKDFHDLSTTSSNQVYTN